MTHLTADELVDAVEGALSDHRAVHLDECAVCRAQVLELTAVLREAEAADVPEPSPMFWNHFSARVREAIDLEPGREAGWLPAWVRWPVLAPLGALALVVILLAGAIPAPWELQTRPRTAGVQVPSASPAMGSAEDASWALVSELAGALDLDDAREAGLMAAPGDAERAALALDASERAELLRLLHSELDRPKS